MVEALLEGVAIEVEGGEVATMLVTLGVGVELGFDLVVEVDVTGDFGSTVVAA